EIQFVKNKKPEKPNVVSDGIFQIRVENFGINDEFVWFKDGVRITGNLPVYKVSTNGRYQSQLATKISDELSCLSEISNTFYVEILDAEQLYIYPNPASQMLYVES